MSMTGVTALSYQCKFWPGSHLSEIFHVAGNLDTRTRIGFSKVCKLWHLFSYCFCLFLSVAFFFFFGFCYF